jgi:hypothetical protein
MITLAQYLMGRDLKYACSDEVRSNARLTVAKTNQLKALAVADGIEFPDDSTEVASGWRPEGVNECTSNAAKLSTHIIAKALDTRDPKRLFARWCLRNLDKLAEIGLWMEDPRWTPDWVHLQTVPPGSGKRVYIPSTKPASASALPEQGGSRGIVTDSGRQLIHS